MRHMKLSGKGGGGVKCEARSGEWTSSLLEGGGNMERSLETSSSLVDVLEIGKLSPIRFSSLKHFHVFC